MFDRRVSVILVLCYCFVSVECVSSDTEQIRTLVRQWAPLIWLAPEEKFMPLNVEEFLENMNIADEQGSVLTRSKHSVRFLQHNSKKHFLVPNKPIELLKANESSFLHGTNPKVHPTVPVYVVITYCPPDPKTNGITRVDAWPKFHITYWMFYPYNEGKDTCFIGKLPTPLFFSKCLGHYRKLGNHVGDWEHLSLSFTGKPYPEKMFVSVHDAGAYYNYDKSLNVFKFESKMHRRGVAQVPRYPEFVRLQGGHPVLFSAEGSHGLWATPGDHEFLRVPKIWDKTGFGTPWKTWANLEYYHIGRTEIPAWLTFKGKWGNPKTKCVLWKKFGFCEYSEGPSGLLREHQDFYC